MLLYLSGIDLARSDSHNPCSKISKKYLTQPKGHEIKVDIFIFPTKYGIPKKFKPISH